MTTKAIRYSSKRSWEGPLENWEAHSECIKHWCDGGVIEMHTGIASYSFVHGPEETWVVIDASVPKFAMNARYRIKQREPKSGEVWLVSCEYCIYSTLIKEDKPWLTLDGKCVKCNADTRDKQFVADNLEQYYANKFTSSD